MKTVIRLLVVIVVIAAAGCLGYFTWRRIEESKNVASVKKPPAQIPKVFVHTIKTRTLERTLIATGNVKAFAEVNVVAKVTGRLDSLRLPDGRLLEEGDEVKKGEVIAIIDHKALAAAVGQAKASLDSARASFDRARVNLEDSDREKKRWDSLFDRSVATEQQRDQALLSYNRSLADVAIAQSQIELARAALLQNEINLQEATIVAPTSGTISQKFVDEGNMVGLNIPLVRISQVDTVKIMASISERYFSYIVPGKTQVRIAADAIPGEEFSGTVYSTGVDFDSVTRTVQIEARVPNPERKLRPGMFARIYIVLERHENVPVIPESALIHKEGKVFCYVANESKIQRQNLTLGIMDGDFHEILEGPAPGEVVVVSGQRLLKEGDTIEMAGEERQ